MVVIELPALPMRGDPYDAEELDALRERLRRIVRRTVGGKLLRDYSMTVTWISAEKSRKHVDVSWSSPLIYEALETSGVLARDQVLWQENRYRTNPRRPRTVVTLRREP